MKTKYKKILTTKEYIDTTLDEQVSQGPLRFTLLELITAMKFFSEDEKLKQGGFRLVYRGVLQEMEEVVAMKQLSQVCRQGKKEYVVEVSIITRMGHRSLV